MKEIVIQLSEEDYKEICSGVKDMSAVYLETTFLLYCAVKNGTVLPEHHGRIVDVDRLQKTFWRNVAGASAFDDIFNNAPTILEAKEQSE